MAKKGRILIVEDEHIVAEDLRQTLKELGYDIAGLTDSGEAAVEMAKETGPDVVLVDVYLSGSMNGLAAAEEINRRLHVPSVILSSHASEAMLAKAVAAGALGYLLKPYRAQELNAAIALALEQHHSSERLHSRYQRLETMLGNLSDAVIATDSDGQIRYLNAVAEVLTGWSYYEAAGRKIEDVLVVESLNGGQAAASQLRRTLATLKPVGGERFVLRQRYGKRIPIEESASPISDGKAPIGAVTIFRDITERLRHERAAYQSKHRLEEQVSSTAAALQQSQTELRALSRHLITAQEEERRAIARELHDDFGQRTALIDMQATRALDLVHEDNPQLRELLEKMRDQVATLSVGLRNVSHRLHPAILTELGLVSALRSLVDNFRSSGGAATAAFPSVAPELPLEAATAIYRIAQEALRNAMKHAPGAPVKLTLTATSDAVELTIKDAGPGFDPNPNKAMAGLGLVSMRERARLAGGAFFLQTSPGAGTTVTTRIPIRAAM